MLFCDVHIDIVIGATLNLLQCLHVICSAAQTNSVETSLALLAM